MWRERPSPAAEVCGGQSLAEALIQMNRTTLFLAATAVPLVLGATSSAQSADDARAVLRDAAEATLALRSARYEAEAQIRGGTSHRIVTGQVVLARFDYTDPIGGRIAVSGQISRSDRSESEPFEIAYDGRTVVRLRPRTRTALVADALYGGEPLFRGVEGSLILDELVAVEPFYAQMQSAAVLDAAKQSVDGVPCHVIMIAGETSETGVTWYISAQDHLPRRFERRYLSASGITVTSVLTLRKLRVDVAVDDSSFRIEPPLDYRVETVGKRPPPMMNVGIIAPEFTLFGSDGREHSLSDYRGKLVVLDFWASRCPNCQNAMPSLQRLHNRYRDQGVVFLGVHCRDRPDVDGAAFARQMGVTFPQLLDGDSITVQYQIRGIPAFFIIGPEGRLMYQSVGFGGDSEARLKAMIEQYLAAKS